jgi:hypothetical protein
MSQRRAIVSCPVSILAALDVAPLTVLDLSLISGIKRKTVLQTIARLHEDNRVKPCGTKRTGKRGCESLIWRRA